VSTTTSADDDLTIVCSSTTYPCWRATTALTSVGGAIRQA
jgi:hypothetical protein